MAWHSVQFLAHSVKGTMNTLWTRNHTTWEWLIDGLVIASSYDIRLDQKKNGIKSKYKNVYVSTVLCFTYLDDNDIKIRKSELSSSKYGRKRYNKNVPLPSVAPPFCFLSCFCSMAWAPCCLWTIHFWLPLLFSLTFIYI